MTVTTMDGIAITTVLVLVLLLIRAWRGPIPEALMRPSHKLILGVDSFIITNQSVDGKWCRIEGGGCCALLNFKKGDVVFIEQGIGRTQMFYVNHVEHQQCKSIAYLVRDPE